MCGNRAGGLSAAWRCVRQPNAARVGVAAQAMRASVQVEKEEADAIAASAAAFRAREVGGP
jgi:hypothetical protein